MANLEEQNSFDEGVYQIETDDVLIGGPEGVANNSAKNLTNRTSWMKTQIDNVVLSAGLEIDDSNLSTLAEALASIVAANSSSLSSALDSNRDDVGATSEAVKIINDALQNIQSLMLVGVPIPWPLPVIPPEHLEMRGQAFDASSFPKLALLYPSFTLPDMRGEFIRGWDNGRGVDISRVIGSSQLDEFKSHQHDLSQGPLTGGSGNQNQYASWWKTGSLSRVGGTYDAGGSETRPRNIAFMYIMRAA